MALGLVADVALHDETIRVVDRVAALEVVVHRHVANEGLVRMNACGLRLLPETGERNGTLPETS